MALDPRAWREREDRGRRPADDMLWRVREVLRIRLEASTETSRAEIEAYDAGDDFPHLVARYFHGPVQRRRMVVALDRSPTTATVTQFVNNVFQPRYGSDVDLPIDLVHLGDAAADKVVQAAAKRRRVPVAIRPFADYQVVWDASDYLTGQTQRLVNSRDCPVDRYIDKRWSSIASAGVRLEKGVLDAAVGTFRRDGPRFLLVLGQFGTGKTFFLRKLALAMADELPSVVPVFIPMRQLEKSRSLDELVAQHMAGSVRMDAFRYMVKEGRVALLFDGFDELALRTSFDRVEEHFAAIREAAQGKAKVVVTSRREHFLSDDDALKAMGSDVLTLAGANIWQILPLDDGSRRRFVVAAFGGDEARADRFLSLLRDIPDTLSLATNARMLTFLVDWANADPQGGPSFEERLQGAAGERPMTAGALYRLIIDTWLDHEERRQRLPGGLPVLSAEQRLAVATALALHLWRTGATSITPLELSAIVQRDGHLPDLEMSADELCQSVATGTLLIRPGEDTFGFVHQSVLEWLVANHLAGAGTLDEELSLHPLTRPMADFLRDLAGGNSTSAWATRVIAAETVAGPRAKANANLLLGRTEAVVEGADFRDQQLRQADFTGRDLSAACFDRADLTGAQLSNATLRGASFRNAILVGARLNEADLIDADLSGANLRTARMLGTGAPSARFVDADLRYSAMVGADLAGAQFVGADLRGSAGPHASAVAQVDSPAGPCHVAFGPDGHVLASAGNDGLVRLWDPATGAALRALKGHGGWARSVAFSPDGAVLASAGDDDSVRLWAPATGAALRVLEGHRDWVRSVAFSPDGAVLASAGDDLSVRLWDPATGAALRVLEGHGDWVRSVAFSPDGAMLASAGDDGAVRLWDPATGAALRVLEGHGAGVQSVAFSPDGAVVASAGDDGAVRLWDPATGAALRVLEGHGAGVRSVAFSPDGAVLASAGDDGAVRLWDPATGAALRVLEGHGAGVRSVAFSPDGAVLASAGDDGAVRLWNPATGAALRVLEGHGGWVRSVAFSPDGAVLASAGDDGAVRLWDPATGAATWVLEGHRDWVQSVAFSPDGAVVASAGDDGAVRLWNPATGAALRVLEGHGAGVRSVAFSPDGAVLASAGDDGAVRLWDPATGAALRVLEGHGAGVRSVAFSPDGAVLASAGDDGAVRLWNPATGAALRVLEGHGAGVQSVAFSPDGAVLASAGNQSTLRLWDPATGAGLRALEGHRGRVLSVSFSPDGAVLASAGADDTVRLWDPADGAALRVLECHRDWVCAVAFSADGAVLASAGADGTVRLWDPANGHAPVVLAALSDGTAVLLPDGSYKLEGNGNGLWWAAGLCRFEPGELDPYVTSIRRVDAGEPLSKWLHPVPGRG